ncbi:hypothetical protein ABPG75_011284 [Micractinium tetrahymenae]
MAAPPLADALNAFGESLFKALQTQVPPPPTGVFLSPLCIAQCLALVLTGAQPEGKSARQLLSIVYGRRGGAGAAAIEQLNSQLSHMLASLMAAGSGGAGMPGAVPSVSSGSSIWVAPRWSLQAAYHEAVARHFGAQAEPLTTADAINGWVSAATRGKITQAVTEDMLRDPSLASVLASVLYFKGEWQSEFDRQVGTQTNLTRPAAFHHLTEQPGGASVGHVAMMHRQFDRTGDTIQMPYKGREFAAVAAMPEGGLHAASPGSPLRLASGVPYAAALAACRGALLGGSLTCMEAYDIRLWLPRFELECEVRLKAVLKAMGVAAPFAEGPGADLTRLATGPHRMYISQLLHKVYVKTDEQGTEAAAVAVALASFGCAAPQHFLDIRFDRPFAFGVVHRASGAALFVGEVLQPEAAAAPAAPSQQSPFGSGWHW